MSPNQQKVCADLALNVIVVCENKKNENGKEIIYHWHLS